MGDFVMTDYKAMYYQLTAKVADAVELLTTAQQQCEEMYIENEDEEGEEVTPQ